MPDMLVNLLNLPDSAPIVTSLKGKGIQIVRPLPPDKHRVLNWVRENSYASAASECDVCFSHTPPSCYIALCGSDILGYACYNATAPDFFGPTMVLSAYQGQGIGKALLLKSLEALREQGYVYAIIGGVGPAEYYQKCVGAVMIADSTPGVYRFFIGGMKKQSTKEEASIL